MTLTAMRPDRGLGKGRETALCSVVQVSASISALRVVPNNKVVISRPERRALLLRARRRKDSGGESWGDVRKRHCLAWEYKGRRANLDAAFDPLRQYALALENPPLLIVSDMARFRIRTNWTNSVSETYEFTRDALADKAIRHVF